MELVPPGTHIDFIGKRRLFVSLSIGIVTSVFTALVITRLLFHVYPGDRTVAELSI